MCHVTREVFASGVKTSQEEKKTSINMGGTESTRKSMFLLSHLREKQLPGLGSWKWGFAFCSFHSTFANTPNETQIEET